MSRNLCPCAFRRYHNKKHTIEPAIELHVGQDTAAIGPVVTGLWRISAGKKIRWDLGYFGGIGNRGPEHAIKANFEFEF